MEEAIKSIERAYKQISAVPVQGDDVDLMAAARENLRRVHRFLLGVPTPDTVKETDEVNADG